MTTKTWYTETCDQCGKEVTWAYDEQYCKPDPDPTGGWTSIYFNCPAKSDDCGRHSYEICSATCLKNFVEENRFPQTVNP